MFYTFVWQVRGRRKKKEKRKKRKEKKRVRRGLGGERERSGARGGERDSEREYAPGHSVLCQENPIRWAWAQERRSKKFRIKLKEKKKKRKA